MIIDKLIEFILEVLKVENESLANTTIHIVFKFFIPLILLIVAYKTIILYICRKLVKKHFSNNKKIKIVFWIKTVLRVIFILLFAFIVKILFGENLIKYIKILFSALNQPFYSAENTSISLFTILMILPIYYFSSWIGKITYKLFDISFFTSSFNNIKDADGKNVYLGNLGVFLKKPDSKKTINAAKILRYGVTFFTFIIGLSFIGINLSSIAVMLGVLGIGLGFGLQNLIANIFAGFVIMLTKPIREGDFINVRGDRGSVTKVNSVSTIVTTRFNETIIVPNSVLISDVIYNDSFSDRSVTIENKVVVSYDSDIELVRYILIGIARRSPYSKKYEEPDARVSGFERAGIEMVLYSIINEVVERGPARAWINLEIWREFKKNGIIIPVSQMDVNIRKEDKL